MTKPSNRKNKQTSQKVKEKKMDTKKFAQQLQKYLKEYDIEAKVVTKGLGRADIILGSK